MFLLREEIRLQTPKIIPSKKFWIYSSVGVKTSNTGLGVRENEYRKTMRMTRISFLALSIMAFVSAATSLLAEVEFSTVLNFPFGYGVPTGAQPQARIVQSSDGALYGTTSLGGIYGQGTVFKITTKGNLLWSLSFNGTNGANPKAEVVPGMDNCFYGTTFSGGVSTNEFGSGCGTVYKVTAHGKLVWSVPFVGTNGANPMAGLLAGPDGHFYGTTMSGGAHGFGTVFRITCKGRLTTLYSFTGNDDGAGPLAGLIRGHDGFLYGTTAHGGLISAVSPPGNGLPFPLFPNTTPGYGTIFKIQPDGHLVTLYSFGTTISPGTSNPGEVPQFEHSLDGANPSAELLLGTDGNFYGTTDAGGPADNGVFFKLTPEGDFELLHAFTGPPDDTVTSSRLVEGRDGKFYGTTTIGGSNNILNSGFGTIFQMTSDGDYTTLFYFDGDNGAFPTAGLFKGCDGIFYGTTMGGFYSPGTVFRISVTEHECSKPKRPPRYERHPRRW